jgi:hypothetical protein
MPVEWQPNAPYLISEVTNNLKGVSPQSTTLNLNPEKLVLRQIAGDGW